MVSMVSNCLDGAHGGSSGFRKGLFWGSQGGELTARQRSEDEKDLSIEKFPEAPEFVLRKYAVGA